VPEVDEEEDEDEEGAAAENFCKKWFLASL
jgi:hypothetical protein